MFRMRVTLVTQSPDCMDVHWETFQVERLPFFLSAGVTNVAVEGALTFEIMRRLFQKITTRDTLS